MAVRCFIYVAVVLIFFCEVVLSLSGGFYADNGRQQSVLYKPFTKKDRNNLQREILHLLGLEHRPKPRHVHPDSHSSAQNYLLDVYNSFKDRDDEKQDEENRDRKQTRKRKKNRKMMESDFIMSFVNRNDKLHKYPHLRHERDRRFWFDVSEVSQEDEIVEAELRIYRNVSRRISNKHLKYILSLYSVREDGTPNANTLELVDEIVISNRANGWLVLNVTGPAVNWISFGKKNLGLYMKIKELDSCKTFFSFMFI
ncbi:Protein 60A [Araneus ventricosus]|uniref:Protein 60A n=1 Tax=Araneus ventricosus TaxID=182803 RepID=A0A4Y2CAU6_ARAVE|nr:Protein 60A [Araneus ventricosus]